MDNLEKLLYLSGVSTEYYNYFGQPCTVPRDDRLNVLLLAGHDIDSPEAIEKAVFELDAEQWLHWLKPFYVVSQSSTIVQVFCHSDQLFQSLQWELLTENGTSTSGVFLPVQSNECGEYYIAGTRYSARELVINSLPIGYHQLSISDGVNTERTMLMVCPEHCYTVPVKESQEKYWGVSCQLYSLRSARNWGIGDFSDLLELIALAAHCGADIISVNPLHAPYSDCPEIISPYSPSDRRFLNPIYIDVEKVPECVASNACQAFFTDDVLVNRIAVLRDVELIDYQEVNRIKYQALELAYSDFVRWQMSSESTRARQFTDFIKSGGDLLQQFVAYESVHNRFATAYRDDVRFFCFLQWLADEQLAHCQHYARELGMQIGVMRDLAVGSIAQGCEVEQSSELYISEITIGAPPDPFSTAGQNWGLPVMDPLAMRKNQYQHFIDLLRTNMANAGALRIDHAMSLMRLWWCLPIEHGQSEKGLYVYYPFHDLLPLLRLESHRNHCVVVGEDLGVIPDHFRAAMLDSNVYGSDVFYFAQHLNHQFKAPEDQRVDALLSVTNHDVPTLNDWWSSGDLQRRYQLGVIADQDTYQRLCAERTRDKGNLLQWLKDNDQLPPLWCVDSTQREFDMALCESIHRLCARGASRMMLLQLEDLQLITLPINIPATNKQYPNWRRKQQMNTHNIFSRAGVKQLLAAVDKERKQ